MSGQTINIQQNNKSIFKAFHLIRDNYNSEQTLATARNSNIVRKTFSSKIEYSIPILNLWWAIKDTMALKYDLEDRLVDFSSRVIQLVESLPSTKSGNYIANQMIRCGVAPALLYGEEQRRRIKRRLCTQNESRSQRIKRNQDIIKDHFKKWNGKKH